jgi:NADPH-dependent ferric siderophore reductase
MSIEGLIPTRRPVPDSLFGGRLRGACLLHLEVVDVRDLAPHVRSVTVASSDLVGFEHAPGQDLMIEFPAGAGSGRRHYTIRHGDSAAGMAKLEFELHDGFGAASLWAAQAELGDRLEAIGPRGTITVRPGATSHVFVADDSTMPATFAIIEARLVETSTTALPVTTHGAESRPAPTAVSNTTLLWIDRSQIVERLAGLQPRASTAAYIFGERHLVRTAEEVLVGIGVPRDAISSKADLQQDQSNAGHDEPAFD